MNLLNFKKSVLVFLTTSLFGMVFIGMNFSEFSSNNVSAQQPIMPTVGPNLAEPIVIPQHIIYGQLFNHVEVLKEKTIESQLQGQNTSWTNNFLQKTGLNSTELSEFNRIENDCIQKIRILDTQAEQIIDNARAQFPNGRLENGQKPPPPPAQLHELQRQKNEAILKAKDEIKHLLGDVRFNSFDSFVQKEIGKIIKPMKIYERTPSRIPPAFQ
jgi:hypothetical protein